METLINSKIPFPCRRESIKFNSLDPCLDMTIQPAFPWFENVIDVVERSMLLSIRLECLRQVGAVMTSEQQHKYFLQTGASLPTPA